MRAHALRPLNVAAAAVALGGALTIATPQWALAVLQVVLAAAAAAAALHALAALVPTTGWISPFRWQSPFHTIAHADRGAHDEDEALLRRKLSGWRRPLRSGTALPTEVMGLLRPLIRAALETDGGPSPDSASARVRLSPTAEAILTSTPARRPFWRPDLPPRPAEVAAVVRSVLDELALLGLDTHDAALTPHPRPERDP